MTDMAGQLEELRTLVDEAGHDYRNLNNGIKIMGTEFLIWIRGDRLELVKLREGAANPAHVAYGSGAEEMLALLLEHAGDPRA